MPSVTRPARDDSHRAIVEQQVLEAVEHLLAGGESFTSLGVQRIAAEAGMARTTFYGHFRDKASLLIRLTESATLRLFTVAADWVRDPGSTRESLEPTVAELIEEYREQAARGQAGGEAERDRASTTATWIAWGTERTIAMHVATYPYDARADAALAAGIAAATWATVQHV